MLKHPARLLRAVGAVALMANAPVTYTPPPARLPGFAAQLAEHPAVTSPWGWRVINHDAAWEAIALAQPDNRQAARWDYAMSLIGQASSGFGDDLGGLATDALGVLDVMQADEPDLLLVPTYRLARGIALARVQRNAEALVMLTDPVLIANPEACLWRLMGQAAQGHAREAMSEASCAVKAINQRKIPAARPFILAASQAAVAAGQSTQALSWLGNLPDGEAAANVMRGRAYMAMGKVGEGRLRLQRAHNTGDEAERNDADLALAEGLVPRGQMSPREALKMLDRIRFTWRGGKVEERALRLGYAIADRLHDRAASLSYGAALLRYFDNGAQAASLLVACQQQLLDALGDGSRMPLADAAGLFWDYRDLAPSGTQGDALLTLLARRLADARLYERAADLLAYQMDARAQDIEKGPVSARVAQLYILAGKPDRALAALRGSDQPVYPPDMLAARHKMEAIALYQMGQSGQALALLDDMPDTAALRGEMLWRRRDWQGLVARLGNISGASKAALSAVDQAVILRNAVALTMLGREADLAKLRSRYGAAFAATPAAAAFSLLTGPVDAMTGDGIARAMAAIPSASVAGEYEALLDTSPAPAPKIASK